MSDYKPKTTVQIIGPAGVASLAPEDLELMRDALLKKWNDLSATVEHVSQSYRTPDGRVLPPASPEVIAAWTEKRDRAAALLRALEGK